MKVLLSIEEGEGRAVGLMVALYFVLGVAFVFVQTTAFGLFIGEYGARNLPFAYLTVAVLASLIAYFYLRLFERLAYPLPVFINLSFLAIVCVIFWIGLRSQLAHWFIFFLPFWFQALLNLANLVVWPLAGRIFDVRQAKRLFGLVGTGNWIANILGGLVIGAILAVSGTSNPYLFAAIAALVAGVVLWAIFRLRLVPASALQSAVRSSVPRENDRPASSPFRDPYNRLIFAKVMLWWVGFYFIDNIFYASASTQFANGAELAAFIGRQLSVVGVIAIITSAFLTGRLIRKFGLRTGLIVMPLVVTACVLVLVIGGILGAPPSFLFWVAAAAKTFNLALGFSISQAAATLLYQPILGNERNRTQTIADGIMQPAAIGIAALLLLLFNTILHLGAVGLSVIFLVIAAAWLWVIFRVSGEYGHVLSEALVKRTLGEATALLFDPAGIAELRAGLKSHRAGAALYALNQLEQLEPHAWQSSIQAALPVLLAHPAPEVRKYVLQRILALKLADAIPLARPRLEHESDPQTYAALIELLATLDAQASAQAIAGALESKERSTRQGALTGLLAGGDPVQVERARDTLDRLVTSPVAEDRLMTAQILANAPFPGAQDYILKLLTDEDVFIRQAAVRAAGQQPDGALLDRLVAACDSPDTAQVAEQVLISKGEAALPVVLSALSEAGEQPASTQRFLSLISVLGVIGGEQGLAALKSRLTTPDAALRSEVLRSLSALGYRARSLNEIMDSLHKELADAAWIAAGIQILDGMQATDAIAPLKGALESAYSDVRHRALLLISFVLNASAVLRADQALTEAGAHPLAFAIESLDTLLPARLKPLLLPLVESLSAAQRLERWRGAGVPIPEMSIQTLVEALIDPAAGIRFSRWAQMCAIHAAGVLKLRSALPLLEPLRSAAEPSLSTMGHWSLERIASDAPAQGETAMLSLVEKVLALKSSSLFSKTPDNVLAAVADLVQEIAFEKDTTIFNKGDLGDSLYIIVTGKVQVWNGDRLLNELGEGGIFGELALLDPAPRSASIKTTESTNLLKLDESHFHIILAERPEVSAAIIRVLTGYLRGYLRDPESINAGGKPSHERK